MMADRRSPDVAERVSERVETIVAAETKILSGIGKWTLSFAGAAVVALVTLLFNQNANINRLEAVNNVANVKMDTLIALVNEMRADLRAAPSLYFSKVEGLDHEQRLRALEHRKGR